MESVEGKKFLYTQARKKTMYQDEKLICKDCGAEFVFTAGEQVFYGEKVFQNKPQRGKACRAAR